MGAVLGLSSGATGGLLGLDGGAGGTGYDSPQQAAVTNPVDQAHLGESYQGVHNSIASQQALLQALQAQNALQNQSQVYNQLQGIATGVGPNPAQQQFQNNVNQIAAQQSGAIASQKGISPALQARLISQQGGAAMQGAAGAGAEALANQQLNALGAAGNMANQQAANQIGVTGADVGANLQNQGNLFGAIGGYNNSQVGMQGNVNSANANLAGQTMQGQQKIIGGVMNGAGAVAGLAHGGMVNGPCSGAGKHLNMKSGGKVPGKAAVSGDSPKNDTVNIKGSPGEIMLPRSVTMSRDAPAEAAKFVAALLAKKKRMKSA